MQTRLLSLFLILVTLLNVLSTRAQNVSMTAITKDSSFFNFSFTQFSPFWRDIDAPRDVKAASAENVMQYQLNGPRLLPLVANSRTLNVYVMPGDRLSFTVDIVNKRPVYHFTGTHENNYNYVMADQLDHPFTPWYKKGSAIDSFRLEVDTWYTNRIRFLNEYHSKYPLTKDAYESYSKELQYTYVTLLYYPLSSGRVRSDSIPPDYFKNPLVSPDLTKAIVTSEEAFRAATIKDIVCSSPVPMENINSTYAHILQTYKGIPREQMIANMIGFYAKSQKQSLYKDLLRIMDSSLHQMKDSASLSYVLRCKQEYTMLNKVLPDDILKNTVLTDYNGNKKLTLAALLEQYPDQPIYISFWASWCGACREDHKDDEAAMALLADKRVVHLFFSLDKQKSEDAWRKAAVEDNITKEQYLVENDFSSSLAKYLTIHSIPRYILLDKKHLLKNANAARPNSYHAEAFKQMVASLTTKIVTFN